MCDVISFCALSTSRRGRRHGAYAGAADRAGRTVGRHAACFARVDRLAADCPVCRAGFLRPEAFTPGAWRPLRLPVRLAGLPHSKACRGEERRRGLAGLSSMADRREVDQMVVGRTYLPRPIAARRPDGGRTDLFCHGDRRAADRTVAGWTCSATADRARRTDVDRPDLYPATVGHRRAGPDGGRLDLSCHGRVTIPGGPERQAGWTCPAMADRRARRQRAAGRLDCDRRAYRRVAGRASRRLDLFCQGRSPVGRPAGLPVPAGLSRARTASRAAARTFSPRPCSFLTCHGDPDGAPPGRQSRPRFSPPTADFAAPHAKLPASPRYVPARTTSSRRLHSSGAAAQSSAATPLLLAKRVGVLSMRMVQHA